METYIDLERRAAERKRLVGSVYDILVELWDAAFMANWHNYDGLEEAEAAVGQVLDRARGGEEVGWDE